MNILIFTRHQWLGASSRYRSIQYFPFFEKAGYSIIHRPLFTDDYLRSRARGKTPYLAVIMSYIRRFISIIIDVRHADIVIVEKEILPYFPACAETALRYMGKPFIYDYDDAIWHAYERLGGGVIGRVLSNKVAYLVKNAEHVIAGSHYIESQCVSWGASSCTRIPTTVPRSRYTGQALTVKKTVDIVWIGSMSTGQYVIPLFPVFNRLHDIYGSTVRLIGCSSSLVAEFPSFIDAVPWSIDSEIDLLSSARIGIMPIPDNKYEQGKCGFKLIQYMGVGLPVVASPVGENRYIVQTDYNGYLANSAEDWFSALSRLIENESLAKQLGKQGYSLYRKKYSTESAAIRYINVLQNVVPNVESS